MPKFLPFLRSEDGAVTVDYVVLLSVAAAAAAATAGALSEGVSDVNRAVETQMGTQGMVGETWATAMANYTPYDEPTYSQLYAGFSSLENPDLDVLEGMVNVLVEQMTPEASTDEEYGMLNDMTFSIGRVYADRVRARPGQTEYDEASVAPILADLGWDQGLVAVNGP
ncbi:hypothetical protein JANAI62_13550 [Jannaschia pagri]|uniref:Uncharacterized protein n=1 Tax=Jannaschia pagri TaxID=2829797 RepID=A0ABQ4NJX7_9RHOB|nr:MULTISPECIES: hypothetical protein [unclassified Jannaschia]GIT90901.1 hypothetical protein JANAI61_13590 [Jannaschia sp. AI_61]GIT94732.1 hypothetical protein JANAI62_13550 [Jannaschia sp. AI_62]